MTTIRKEISKIKPFVPGICLVILLITACSPQARAAEPQSIEPLALAPGDETGGYVELVDALRAQNANVQPLDVIEPSFFDVQGQLITINRVEVQVFEFANEIAREAAAAKISPDGSSIGTTMVTWIDRPNFWAKGRVVHPRLAQQHRRPTRQFRQRISPPLLLSASLSKPAPPLPR